MLYRARRDRRELTVLVRRFAVLTNVLYPFAGITGDVSTGRRGQQDGRAEDAKRCNDFDGSFLQSLAAGTQ
jgi:hypothetical protein